MTPTFDKVHNRFKLNGIHFNHNDLKEVAYSLIKEGLTFEKEIGNFLIDWLNDKNYIVVKTSGSTGQPKPLKIKKQAMVNSALKTGDFFDLKPGSSALHCLPSYYIAGKMMLVRAMVLGLELDYIEPSSAPQINQSKTYEFCAMIPLQVANVINSLSNIKCLLIGGTQINAALKAKIKAFTNKCYESYGMTETVTHVAVRPLSTKDFKGDAYFSALPKVSFSKDNRQCLVINAPELFVTDLVTNDVVDLRSETSFKFLGRYDNVINSGGVKLFPEQIEQKLQPFIKQRYIIASEEDTDLGEKLILILENPTDTIESISKKIKTLKTLDKFEIPKKIYTLEKFPETNTGKIQRKNTIDAILGR